jgi:hypothetical protein
MRRMVMSKCAACGVENKEGSRFCTGCGNPLPHGIVATKLKCLKCGEMNYPDNKFCKGCGMPLQQETKEFPAKCSACGAGNSPNSSFCTSCGATLLPVTGAMSVSVHEKAASPGSFSEEEALKLFVGGKASYYLPRWKLIETTGKKKSWNVAAALFTGIWMAYRKMYLYAGITLGIVIVWTIAELRLGSNQTINLGISVLLMMCSGMLGNWLYYIHAKEKIAETKVQCPDPEVQKSEMIKAGGTSRLALGLVIGFFVIWGAIAGYVEYEASTKGGLEANKLTFNGGDLYYAPPVKEAEAKKLGEYLTRGKFFDGSPKSVQIEKSGNIWEFRMVVKQGYEKDEKVVENMKEVAAELSKNVFEEAPVDVHLCDPYFKTLRVVNFPKSQKGVAHSQYGVKLVFSGGELYYTQPVTRSEAEKLGQYLVQAKFFDGTPKTAQINKSGQTYQFRYVVMKGYDQKKEYIDLVKQFSAELSGGVFHNAPVDIHLCDSYLKTRRVVKFAE